MGTIPLPERPTATVDAGLSYGSYQWTEREQKAMHLLVDAGGVRLERGDAVRLGDGTCGRVIGHEGDYVLLLVTKQVRRIDPHEVVRLLEDSR